MRWNQSWQSVARLEDGEQILAEACKSEGVWHLFLRDGRKSGAPHFTSAILAMRAAEDTLGVRISQ